MPDYRELRISVALTNVIRNYKYEEQTMIQDIVSPQEAVGGSTGTFKTLGKEIIRTGISDALGPHGKASELSYSASESSYTCQPYAFKMMVTDRDVRDSPTIHNPRKHATIMCMHGLKLRRELRLVTLADATSNATAIAPDWDDDAATIVADVLAGKKSQKALLGFKPNTFVFGDHIGDEIIGQQDIIDYLKTVAALQKPSSWFESLDGSDLPSKFFKMRLLQPDVMHDTALEGATVSLENVWGDNAYLIHVDGSGNTRTWSLTAMRQKMVVVTWRSNDPSGEWVKVEWEYDTVEVNSDALWELTDVT